MAHIAFVTVAEDTPRFELNRVAAKSSGTEGVMADTPEEDTNSWNLRQPD